MLPVNLANRLLATDNIGYFWGVQFCNTFLASLHNLLFSLLTMTATKEIPPLPVPSRLSNPFKKDGPAWLTWPSRVNAVAFRLTAEWEFT